MVNDPAAVQEQLQTLMTNLEHEQERTLREITEIDTLLRQTQIEVEKLSQRELSVANRLQLLEDEWTIQQLDNRGIRLSISSYYGQCPGSGHGHIERTVC